MAPFPEEEIMTIKRLEVALRKSDFKLLKEGAYKLHEKYHQHHHFQYLDLLENILNDVQQNYTVPSDIKDILIPTIQDILLNNKEENNRISSLTSLSYGVNQMETSSNLEERNNSVNTLQKENINQNIMQRDDYIKPFQEFAPIKSIEMASNNIAEVEDTIKIHDNTNSQLIVESYNERLNEDFDTGTPFVQQQQDIFKEIKPEQSEDTIDSVKQEEQYERIEFLKNDTEVENKEIITSKQAVSDFDKQDAIKKETMNETETKTEAKIEENKEGKEQKTITIFFGQNSSNEKNKNILKYRELIKSHGNFNFSELIILINEIKTQSNINVSELKTFIEQLKTTNHKVNLITTSQSANFVELFKQSDVKYSIFQDDEDKKINFMPIFGLTNLHKCMECKNEFLEQNETINSFVFQCPQCKGAMFPEIYSPFGQVNMDYYNSALIALANSDIWLLICTPLNEKLTFNLIRTASKVNPKLKEVYILDKDINIRETYRKTIQDIHPDIKINNGLNAMEDFINNSK